MALSQKAKIRILLVEDHPVTRHGVRKLLQADRRFSVVGEAGDGERAVGLAKELQPDVLMVDINLPKLNGVEVTRRLRAALPGLIIIALTAYDDEEYVDAMLEAGASGYLLKSIGEAELAQAVRGALAGEIVLDRQIAGKIFPRGTRRPGGRPSPLSQKEIRILTLVAEGMASDKIAQDLGVSLRTAKLYLSAIFDKLGTTSRTPSVVKALKQGWLKLEDLKV